MSNLGLTTITSLKGGVGKSSIASALCLELSFSGEEVPIITNDVISPLEKILGKDRAMVIDQDQDFPTSITTDDDCIVDLGGFIDARTIGIIKKSKQVVIPTLTSRLSLDGLITTIQEIKDYNNEIIIVLNQYEKKEVDAVVGWIREQHNYPIFKIKTSKCFDNLHYQKKSISQMMKEEPLMRRAYKEVQSQLHEIISHLQGV